MIEAVKEKQNHSLLKRVVEFQQAVGGEEPAWLTQLRRSGAQLFEEKGFPTTREEAWRFTDITPLKQHEYVFSGEVEGLAQAEIDRHPFADLGCHRMVFVDGIFNSRLSSTDPPDGIQARSLAQVLKNDPDSIRPHLGKYVDVHEQIFSALNTAFLKEGAVIEVKEGCVVDRPIHLLFLNRGSSHPTMLHPRVLILAGDRSQSSIVETHLGIADSVYWTNPVTEIVAGDDTVVDFYKLQKESDRAFHIATVQGQQGRNSTIRATTISLGGAIIRNETNSCLNGEGGWAELNGLFLVDQDQHIDNFTRLDHAKPHCDSREVYKGILDDRARGVFRGRIVVAKGAQKTDSKQTNNNLLLSDQALINTKPQLEIYADDVKCTHGATIGQLNSDAIFYLRSRGIDEKTARSILVYAFASEVVAEIKVDPLMTQLDEYLFEWLPRGELVREAV